MMIKMMMMIICRSVIAGDMIMQIGNLEVEVNKEVREVKMIIKLIVSIFLLRVEN